jgi:uncharacterized protein
MNKRINKIKLAISTECNLKCPYCFVKKTNEKMNLATGQKAVDLLIQSPGREKILAMYGGEPLLNFEFIKKIIPYASFQAQQFKKDIIFSICTNGTLLNLAYLNFFKKYNIKLIISLVGSSLVHNRFRYFNKKIGSYGFFKKNLSLVFKKIPSQNLGASFCVFPSLSHRIYKDFNHLIKLGFNYINFEIIRDFEIWSEKKVLNFSINLNKIIKDIFYNISREKNIFLNPINWEIKYQIFSSKPPLKCPFNYDLEIYPSGDMAFSPFLLNLNEKENYIIGNINKFIARKFNKCQFNPKSRQCQKCETDYYKGCNSDKQANQVYDLYQSHCLKAAEQIQHFSYKNKRFYAYVQKIKKEICF